MRFVANADGTQPNARDRARAQPVPRAGRRGRRRAGAAGAAAGAAAGGPRWSGGAPGGAPAAARAAAEAGRGRAAMPEGYANPHPPPVFEFKTADWNVLEVQVDANILRGWLNNGPEPGVANGAADEERGRYGPVALYAGGTGEVRFKDIGVKDLGRHVCAGRNRLAAVQDAAPVELQLRAGPPPLPTSIATASRYRRRPVVLPRTGLHRLARDRAHPDVESQQPVSQ